MDFVSADNMARQTFGAHKAILGANKWIIENLANVDALPESGYDFYNMVYKLEDGSGAPSRVFAVPSGTGPVRHV